MARSHTRKFRDIVSILGISILAIIVVGIIIHYSYNVGYHDGVTEFERWLQHMSSGAQSKPGMEG